MGFSVLFFSLIKKFNKEVNMDKPKNPIDPKTNPFLEFTFQVLSLHTYFRLKILNLLKLQTFHFFILLSSC